MTIVPQSIKYKCTVMYYSIKAW